jgi:hypothetical protein
MFPLFYYHHKLNFKRENCNILLELSFARQLRKLKEAESQQKHYLFCMGSNHKHTRVPFPSLPSPPLHHTREAQISGCLPYNYYQGMLTKECTRVYISSIRLMNQLPLLGDD